MRTPANNNPLPLNADRLFEAAEAAFAAASRHAAKNEGRYTSPALLKADGDDSAELDSFTLEEIIDATAFLARMGFFPTSARAARG